MLPPSDLQGGATRYPSGGAFRSGWAERMARTDGRAFAEPTAAEEAAKADKAAEAKRKKDEREAQGPRKGRAAKAQPTHEVAGELAALGAANGWGEGAAGGGPTMAQLTAGAAPLRRSAPPPTFGASLALALAPPMRHSSKLRCCARA